MEAAHRFNFFKLGICIILETDAFPNYSYKDHITKLLLPNKSLSNLVTLNNNHHDGRIFFVRYQNLVYVIDSKIHYL